MSAFLLIVFILLAIIIGLIVHEFGHFIFAKLFKVNVKEFAIGIGPKIFSYQFKNTKFSLNLIPVMAFVRIDSIRSLTLFGEIRDEYQKEADQYFAKNGERIRNKNGFYFVLKRGRKVKEWNWYIANKYANLLKKIKHYDNFATRIPNKLIIDDISRWQQLIIYFGGIFFNLILFAIFYVVQYFEFNITESPFVQVGDSFYLLLKNMVFYNLWGTTKSAGTAFGSVAEIEQNGGIALSSISLVIVNYFCIFNLMLFFFNFIPIPPLDGYKIATTSFAKLVKINVSEKVRTGIEIFGMFLMIYIFATAIIADFLM